MDFLGPGEDFETTRLLAFYIPKKSAQAAFKVTSGRKLTRAALSPCFEVQQSQSSKAAISIHDGLAQAQRRFGI